MRATYIRFVIGERDDDARASLGFLNAAYDLLDSAEIADVDRARLRSLVRWFEESLPVPCRFSRSRRHSAANLAISWFRSAATQCVRRAREVCAILDDYDRSTRTLTTDRPGYVVFSDDLQVVAEPFRDSRF